MNTETSTGDDHAVTSVQGSSGGYAPLWERIGRHRWTVALVVGLLSAVCAGALVMQFHTPLYEATALVTIEDVRPFVAFSDRDTGNQSQRYAQSQLELLRSPIVLEPVVNRAEIAALHEISDQDDPVQYLRDHMTIKRAGMSELYTIAFKSESPSSAASVVNAVVAEYLTNHSRYEFERPQRLIKILDDESRLRELEVKRLRTRVLELSIEATGKDPFGHDLMLDHDNDLSPVANLRETLLEIEVDRETLVAEIRYLKQHASPEEEHDNASIVPDSESVMFPEIRAWQAATEENASLMEQIKETDANWRDNPNYVQLDKNVQSQDSALEKVKQELRERLDGHINRREEHSDQAIAAIESKLAGLAAKKQFLSHQLEEITKKQENRKARLVELQFARAELSREEKVFERIAERKLACQAELRAPSRVALRRAASVPTEPDARLPYGRLAIASSAALLAPFAIAIAFRPPKRQSEQSNAAT